MAVATDRMQTELAVPSPRVTWMGAAGLASLGAGAIHAAAIGVHAETRPAAITFTILAALQLGWGGLALVRSGKLVAALGLILGVGSVGGWVLAKTAGIGFIQGLDVAEPVQTADGLCALLALASVVLIGISLKASTSTDGTKRVHLSLIAPGVAFLTLIGMVAAGTHVHDHGEAGLETGSGHTHSHGDAAAPAGSGSADGHTHDPAVVPPHPYDPTKPIDLSGVPGVTPEQQAAAENLIAVTLLRLPKWSDPAVAEAAGFHSIGDGMTGTEHFVNEKFMNDDTILDPDQPESLVYDTSSGKRKLAAAMYMEKPGMPLADVPNIGGPLMQWHVHNNLCYLPTGRIGGLTDGNGNCRPGLIKPPETPMIHVWIEPHECGPFAALEGIGGGKIADGETKLCDHVHGSS